MEERLKTVEEAVVAFRSGQEYTNDKLEKIDKTLNVLAELRGEMLLLVKQQQDNDTEHDEIFTRLRDLETTQVRCSEKRSTNANDIKSLKTNQWWAVTGILGAMGAAVASFFTKQ